jgi:hypothetical protein
MTVAALPAKWRATAATLRTYSASPHAEVVEQLAAELEAAVRQQALEALSLEAAARESGYSYSALQKMVASGKLENVAKKGSPRVRRGDLPKKAGTRNGGIADAILNERRGRIRCSA